MSLQLRIFFVAIGLIAAMGHSVKAGAQGLCSEVFNQISIGGRANLMDSVAEIARMKLEIDLGKNLRDKNSSMRLKMLEIEYPKRWKDLVAKNAGHISEAELKNLVRERILQEQGIVKSERPSQESIDEFIVRKRSQTLPVYKFAGETSLMSYASYVVASSPKLLGYSPSTGKVLIGIGSSSKIEVFDLKNHSKVKLVENVKATRLSVDGRTLLILNTDRLFLSYDVDNLQIRHEVQLDPKAFPGKDVLYNKIDISPDGKWIAVGNDNGKVMIFDAHTGQVHATVKNDWIGPEKITEVRFVNNDSVAFDSHHAFYRYDISTNTRHVVPIEQDGIVSMGISADGTLATLVQLRRAITVDIQKLQVVGMEEIFQESAILQKFKEVPNDTGGHFVLIDGTGTNDPAIYGQRNLKDKIFEFEGRYSNSQESAKTGRYIKDVIFSPEKDVAIVLLNHGGEPLIDMWHLHE
jgi:hypothetical protein